ncbi:Sec-independent protein translocase protein TatB [Chloroflexota bacterium]
MGFSGIGAFEILVILVIAFLVLGPKRLPEVARKLGQAVRTIKKASSDLTTTLSRELEVKEKGPTPTPPVKEGQTETKESPPTVNQANSPGQEDPPTKPGESTEAK